MMVLRPSVLVLVPLDIRTVAGVPLVVERLASLA